MVHREGFYTSLSVALGLLWIAGGRTALAQAAPMPVTNRNIMFQASISGYPDSPTKNVSGTNQTFAVQVSAWSTMGPPPNPHWDSAWVSYVKISIGGQVVDTRTLPEPTSPGLGETRSYSVQWDTTHFPHGLLESNTQEIKVEAMCKVKEGANTTEFAATDATVNVRVYNWGAVMNQAALEEGYPVVGLIKTRLENMRH